MADPLDQLVQDGILDAVISRLKSGKEADIYLVQHAGEIVAAKLYKAREARNFRNNAAYKEGRQVRNSRTQRAMNKGTRFGQAAAEEAWKAKEYEVLVQLHQAGARVPQPVLFYEGVLLMEAVIDAEGHPAPRLIDAIVPVDVAAGFYADIRAQMVKMLTCDLIHGDLSPYNILLAWNGPTLIDFPQVVGAAHNNRAELFFQRDLSTVHRFFAAVDPRLEAHANDGREIWRAYQRRELTADFVPTGRLAGGPSGPPQHRHPRAGKGQAQGPRPGHPGPPRKERRERRPAEPSRAQEPSAARQGGGGPAVSYAPRAGTPASGAPRSGPSQGRGHFRRRPR